MEEQFEGEMSARYSELVETKDLVNNLVKQLQEAKVRISIFHANQGTAFNFHESQGADFNVYKSQGTHFNFHESLGTHFILHESRGTDFNFHESQRSHGTISKVNLEGQGQRSEM